MAFVGHPSAPDNYGSGRLQQQRPKSSVFKSLIHRRNNSDGTDLPSAFSKPETRDEQQQARTSPYTPEYGVPPTEMGLPSFARQARALGELPHSQQNQQTQQDQASVPWMSSPKKARDRSRSPQKSAFATISLKALATKDISKTSKDKTAPESPTKPKKAKSSTNLASLLSRPKSSKNLKKTGSDEEMGNLRDKENRTPEGSVAATPIYAQFCSTGAPEPPRMPAHIFGNASTTSLASAGADPLPVKADLKQRPKSFQPHYFTKPSFTGTGGPKDGIAGRFSRDSSDGSQRSQASNKKEKISRPRVLTTFSGFGSKPASGSTTPATKTKMAEPMIDPKDIDAHLEALLDRRNIPENQRYKMRSLNDTIKMEFIRQDWAETQAKNAALQQQQQQGEQSQLRAGDCDTPIETANAGVSEKEKSKSKHGRGRSFTLSKGNKTPSTSPSKKKAEGTTLGRHFRSKSTESVASVDRPSSSGSGAVSGGIAGGVGGFFAKAIKSQPTPSDFVSYLQKTQKPELVEVGKLHKLRLLLRNETVAWIEDFVRLGGMKEVVGLLNRILKVEWREEHEDALLHENLLCLKALCTTALAMQYLHSIQASLFPALIHMLFDPEKKGPSEFTTRNIVTSVLFTYIESAPAAERVARAATVLSYLRDPEGKEEERPVSFVLEMRKERPYRVWCKELVSVTKEVFWIFLHTLNVVALPADKCTKGGQPIDVRPQMQPPPSGSTGGAANARACAEGQVSSSSAGGRGGSSSSLGSEHDLHGYMIRHFPQERPPVPAAPYVGGVEWDATNYLASHLELINAIVACTPSAEARNALRSQLRISGFERCMGGSLRLCKEKFYGAVHDGLRTWVAAAHDDGWDVRDVRYGPPPEPASARASPTRKPGLTPAARKKLEEPAPKLDVPRLDLGLGSAAAGGARSPASPAAPRGAVGANAGLSSSDDMWLS